MQAGLSHSPVHSQHHTTASAPLLQIMRNPEALSTIQNNNRVRIVYDPGADQHHPSQNLDDEEQEQLHRAMEASLRATTHSPAAAAAPSAAVAYFHKSSALPYTTTVHNGFYACFGDFPEVAGADEVPSLAFLATCARIEDREVILFDVSDDEALLSWKHEIISSCPATAPHEQVRWAAQQVARRLGGAASDAAQRQRYSEYSATMQAQLETVVLPAGELRVRFLLSICRHLPACRGSHAIGKTMWQTSLHRFVALQASVTISGYLICESPWPAACALQCMEVSRHPAKDAHVLRTDRPKLPPGPLLQACPRVARHPQLRLPPLTRRHSVAHRRRRQPARRRRQWRR